jgi:hypothetical protein
MLNDEYWRNINKMQNILGPYRTWFKLKTL